MPDEGNFAFCDGARLALGFQFVQTFQRAVSIDLQCAQPNNFRAGEDQGAGEERGIAAHTQKPAKRFAQFFTDDKSRGMFRAS